LTRAQLRSANDQLAAAAVAAGGGIESLIAATGLRTRANVLRAIEPAIVLRALANDAAARGSAPVGCANSVLMLRGGIRGSVRRVDLGARCGPVWLGSRAGVLAVRGRVA
jgi:hypothetical protein